MESNSYRHIKDKDLVFLAACKVGVSNNNKNNDAEISGLIRPLLSNKNVILSLWNVDDSSTFELVKQFYTFLKETGNIQLSFDKAYNKLKDKYIEGIGFYAPFYLINTGDDYANFK